MSTVPRVRVCYLLFACLLTAFSLAKADFPTNAVVNNELYGLSWTGDGSGDGKDPYAVYFASGSSLTLILFGPNGGDAALGNDFYGAYTGAADAAFGSWNGGFGLSLGGSVSSAGIPQLIVYAPGPVSDWTLYGYDGSYNRASAGDQTWAAYNGLPDGLIYTIGSGIPVYRFQASSTPQTLDARSGWPSSTLFTPPHQIYVGNQLVTESWESESVGNGYHASVCYGDGVTAPYASLDYYITASSQYGLFWGSIDVATFSAQWSPQDGTLQALGQVGLSFAPTSPVIGPPRILPWLSGAGWSADPLNFAFTDANGSDVYADSSGQRTVTISPNDAVASSIFGTPDTGRYAPETQRFTMNAYTLAAVGADGNSLVGLSPGISVRTAGAPVQHFTGALDGTHTPDYVLHCSDGTYLSVVCSGFSPGDYLNCDGSPWYRYDGGDLSIDGSNGWPPSSLPAFPSNIYVDGVSYTQTGVTDGGAGSQFWNQTWYGAPGLDPSQNCVSFAYGLAGGTLWMSYSIETQASGVSYGTLNPWTLEVQPQAGSATLSFNPPPLGAPLWGPAAIAWQGLNYTFSYHDASENNDVYACFVVSDVYPLVLSPDGAVSQRDFSGNVTTLGYSYDPGRGRFGAEGDYTMVALDGNGDPLNVRGGVVIYSGDAYIGTAILLGSGDYMGGSDPGVLHIQRVDGSWGIWYLQVPDGAVFRCRDSSGLFTSPVYCYHQGGATQVIDTTANGWPDSGFLPDVLYVNNHIATRDARPPDGPALGDAPGESVTYHILNDVGPTTDFVVSWQFDSTFSASVEGTYGRFVDFTGAWDGNRTFSQLPSGLMITLQRVSSTSHFGPPQIRWNGTIFTYDPGATALEPNGRDVYTDAAGDSVSAAIAAGGAATLYLADGTSVAGSYDAATHQFQFGGQNVGSLTALDANGNAYDGVGHGSTGALPQTIPGDLDVLGNTFTLGSWLNASGNNLNALSLSYFKAAGDSPTTLEFSSMHAATEWVWAHSRTDGDWQQVATMKVDSTHGLTIYDPAQPNRPVIVLDPTGKSHLEPQGDLPMGEFTATPQ